MQKDKSCSEHEKEIDEEYYKRLRKGLERSSRYNNENYYDSFELERGEGI